MNNNTEISLLLIKRGANIHVKDSGNDTPLLYATEKNNTEIPISLLLIERGADIHRRIHIIIINLYYLLLGMK